MALVQPYAEKEGNMLVKSHLNHFETTNLRWSSKMTTYHDTEKGSVDWAKF